MSLVRSTENNKIDGYYRSGKGIRIGIQRLEPLTGARKRKKIPLQLIFNNSRSSILPESAPDPKIDSLDIVLKWT